MQNCLSLGLMILVWKLPTIMDEKGESIQNIFLEYAFSIKEKDVNRKHNMPIFWLCFNLLFHPFSLGNIPDCWEPQSRKEIQLKRTEKHYKYCLPFDYTNPSQ